MLNPPVTQLDTFEQLTPPTALRTYVVDTSVLLSDPWALRKFAEHSVVLPLVVITELENKRHHPELGWYARQALRFLEDLRADYDRLDQPMPVNVDGGTLRVELNHQSQENLPAALRGTENDNRILACAYNFLQEGKDTVLVTKDVPLRVKAGAVGLPAQEYRAQDVVLTGYTGMAELEVSGEEIDELYATGFVAVDTGELPAHCGVRVQACLLYTSPSPRDS